MNKPAREFYQISLKLTLRDSSGKILLMKAQEKDYYGGYYDLPGGRINVDEFTIPLTDILRREVREEIGAIQYDLNPRPVAVARHMIPAHISSLKRDVPNLYLLYEAQYHGSEIAPSPEHTGFEWFDLKTTDFAKLLKSGNLEGLKMYLEWRAH